ncbi:MAG: hypothetical protein K9H64_08510 [Bacteroidales bacterium]|nr:hypothetical protein [Bacteroidales bacterium]MCF8455873.1 hypothetical protein [Bacteroidales bacterium]
MSKANDISECTPTRKEKGLVANFCSHCAGVIVIEEFEKGHRPFWQSLFSTPKTQPLHTCSNCGKAYSESERWAIVEAIAEKEEHEREIQRLYASTLTACLTHIAMIEIGCSMHVEKQIWKVKQSFVEFDSDINEALAKVRASTNPEDIVYPALRLSSQKLSPEVMMHIIGHCAKVFMQDCNMAEKAETLIKEYLLVCGISKNRYEEIVNLKMEG